MYVVLCRNCDGRRSPMAISCTQDAERRRGTGRVTVVGRPAAEILRMKSELLQSAEYGAGAATTGTGSRGVRRLSPEAGASFRSLAPSPAPPHRTVREVSLIKCCRLDFSAFAWMFSDLPSG